MSLEDLKKNLEADGANKDVSMKDLLELGMLQVKLEGELDKLENDVKEKKKELNAIRMGKLPDLMASVPGGGMADFTLGDGRSVKLKTSLTCSVSKDKKEAVIARVIELDPEQGPEMVSEVMTLNLGKGASTSNLIGDLKGYLVDKEIPFEITKDVKTPTLKAWLSKRLKDEREKGDSTLDLGFFGAFEVREAKISAK